MKAGKLLSSLHIEPAVLGSAASDEERPTRPTKPKLLVLVDMNGTLLHRSKLNLGPCDFKVMDLHCYFRNLAKQFVRWLSSNADLDFCFYTSMKKKSASPLADQLMPRGQKAHLLDQSFNKRDELGENSWSMMRDLPRVWASREHPSFGHSEKTTIMIDDSMSKMREYPDNVVILKEFTEADVHESKRLADDTLAATTHFIEILLRYWKEREDVDDIRLIMREELQRS